MACSCTLHHLMFLNWDRHENYISEKIISPRFYSSFFNKKKSKRKKNIQKVNQNSEEIKLKKYYRQKRREQRQILLPHVRRIYERIVALKVKKSEDMTRSMDGFKICIQSFHTDHYQTCLINNGFHVDMRDITSKKKIRKRKPFAGFFCQREMSNVVECSISQLSFGAAPSCIGT